MMCICDASGRGMIAGTRLDGCVAGLFGGLKSAVAGKDGEAGEQVLLIGFKLCLRLARVPPR